MMTREDAIQLINRQQDQSIIQDGGYVKQQTTRVATFKNLLCYFMYLSKERKNEIIH